MLLMGAPTPSEAAAVYRDSGTPTPNLSAFVPRYVQNPRRVGYGNMEEHRMFLETFRTHCKPPKMLVDSASFVITLRKLSSTVADADLSRLVFWQNGVERFNTHIWSPNEPAGTVKTLRFHLASLPPVGGAVRVNDGRGLDLLTGGDFSFSVNDDASVLSARLNYRCGSERGNPSAQPGSEISNQSYNPAPAITLPATPSPSGPTFRAKIPVGSNSPGDAPCTRPGSAYTRANMRDSTYLTRVRAGLDQQCRGHGSQQGIFSSAVFSACTAGTPDGRISYFVEIDVTCAP
jgi:hypothetical protein